MNFKRLVVFLAVCTVWAVSSAREVTWQEFLEIHDKLAEDKTIFVSDSTGSSKLLVSKIASGWGKDVDVYLDKDLIAHETEHHYRGDIGGQVFRFAIDYKGEIRFFGEHAFVYSGGRFSVSEVHRERKRMNHNNITCGTSGFTENTYKREYKHSHKRTAVNEPLTPTNDNITYTIRVAVETDYHTYMTYNDTTKLQRNLNAVFADVNDIYFRELNVKVKIQKLFLYKNESDDIFHNDSNDASKLLRSVTDVYAKGGDTEKVAFFKHNHTVDAVMFLTTRGPFARGIGGVSYTNTLCSYLAIGVSEMYGPKDKHYHVDIVQTVAHELGHILGSVHTHCYNAISIDGFESTAVDHCENKAQLPDGKFCFRGARSTPKDGGSIMSHCGHLSKLEDLTFGSKGTHGFNSQRVGLVLRTRLEEAASRIKSCMLRNGAQGHEDNEDLSLSKRRISTYVVIFMLVLVALTFTGCAIYQISACRQVPSKD